MMVPILIAIALGLAVFAGGESFPKFRAERPGPKAPEESFRAWVAAALPQWWDDVEAEERAKGASDQTLVDAMRLIEPFGPTPAGFGARYDAILREQAPPEALETLITFAQKKAAEFRAAVKRLRAGNVVG